MYAKIRRGRRDGRGAGCFMIGPAAGGQASGATAPLFNARTRRRGRDVSTEKDGNLCLSLSMFGGVKQIIELIKLIWGEDVSGLILTTWRVERCLEYTADA